MAIPWLPPEPIIPPPQVASSEGVVALGGDTHPDRLLSAYSQGIFPWPHDGMPLLWFSPDPRFVLFLNEIQIARSLRKTLRKAPYEIRMDTRFSDVIAACSNAKRPGQRGTWINGEMQAGYGQLHKKGYVHSVEAFEEGALVGGLYGVCIGKMFFGESMFADRPDASKVAFVTLLGHLIRWGFKMVDCQSHTDHLARFGARHIPRSLFLNFVDDAVMQSHPPRSWQCAMGALEAAS
jgi:leucyl/phenylalanyl-tRNA--protein transferase